MQKLSPKGELLSLLDQRKHQSTKRLYERLGGVGIFGLGILPRSENGRHPWRPPFGCGGVQALFGASKNSLVFDRPFLRMQESRVFDCREAEDTGSLSSQG
jgi:hypothetical protein